MTESLAIRATPVAPNPADDDPRVVRRERRAVRLAAWVACCDIVVGLMAWIYGPCLYVAVYPYIWKGRLVIGLWALLLTVAGVGMMVIGFRLWRQLREDRPALGRTMGWSVVWSQLACIPIFCWAPFLISFGISHRGYVGYDSWAAGSAALGGAPLVPFACSLIAWARHRRVYATLPPSPAVSERRRRRLATVAFSGCAVVLVGAWALPGGPRLLGNPATHEGQTVDQWVSRGIGGDPAAVEALDALGEAALPTVVAQLPPPDGLREYLAWWLGEAFDLADNAASVFTGMRIGPMDTDDALERLRFLGTSLAPAASEIVAWVTTMDTDERREAGGYLLASMGPAAVPAWLPLLEHREWRNAILEKGAARLRRAPEDPRWPAERLRPLLHIMNDTGYVPWRIGAAAVFVRSADQAALRAHAVPIARRVIRGPDPDERSNWVMLLAEMGSAGLHLRPELLELAASDDPLWPDAFFVLGKLRDASPEFGALLDAGARSDDPRRRTAVLDALLAAGSGFGPTAELVGRVIAAGNVEDAIAAIRVLAFDEGGLATHWSRLEQALAGATPAQRDRVASALASLGRLGRPAEGWLVRAAKLRPSSRRFNPFENALKTVQSDYVPKGEPHRIVGRRGRRRK